MSLKNYYEYIHTLLSDDQWQDYTACATTGVMRSLTWSGHRPWVNVRSLLESQGREFEQPGFAVSDNHMYVQREDKSVPLGHHRAHQGGWYYIQESAASMPPTLIDYQPDDVILDMCAAPGGKTSQLASNLLALGGSGFVVANEIDNTRRRTLQENISRMGLYNVTVSYRHSSRRAEHYPSTFDHIVVDAVCSGEGTIFRTADFMDMWGIGLTHKNAQIQKDIIRDAIACLKPGGTLVFSTCTLNTNENEGVVARVLENYADEMELVPVDIEGSSPGLPGYGLSNEDCHKVARFWPHIQKSGGFWVSKFYKRGGRSGEQELNNYRRSKAPKLQTSLPSHCGSRAMLKSSFGITLPEHTRVYEDRGYGYLTTTQKLAGYESGLPILKLGHGGITPLAPLVPALGYLSNLPRVELNNEQIQQWMSSTEIEFPLETIGNPREDKGGGGKPGDLGKEIKGRVIVSCHGFDVGLGKMGGGVLKNKM